MGSYPVQTTTPWTTLGKPAGLVRNRDGSRNDFSVRWDMDTSAPGMNGRTSVTRRFATRDEAVAAITTGMGRAYRATAFDGTTVATQIAMRSNPRHRRNRAKVAA